MGANDLLVSIIGEWREIKNEFWVLIKQYGDGTYLADFEWRKVVLLDNYCLEEFYMLLNKHKKILSYVQKYGSNWAESYMGYMDGVGETSSVEDIWWSDKIEWATIIESQTLDKKKNFVESLARSYLQLPKALNLLFLYNQSNRTIGREKSLWYDSDSLNIEKNKFLFYNMYNALIYKEELWKLLHENKWLDLLLAFFDNQNGEDWYNDVYFSESQRAEFDILKRDISEGFQEGLLADQDLMQPVNWNTQFLRENIDKIYSFCSMQILIDSGNWAKKLFSNKEISDSLGKILQSIYSKNYPYKAYIVAEDLSSKSMKVLLWWGSLHDIFHWNQSWAACFIDDPSKKWVGVVTEIWKLANSDDKWSAFQVIKVLKEEIKNPKYGTVYMTTRNESGNIEWSNIEWVHWDEIPPLAWQRVSMLADVIKEFQKLWWIAPWYIMANGTIEILDLRMFLTKHSTDQLIESFSWWKKIYFSDTQYWATANKIIRDNLWLDFDVLGNIEDIETIEEETIQKSTIALKYPESDPELRAHGNLEVTLDSLWKSNISMINDEVKRLWVNIILFKLDVTDPKTVNLQKYLESQWYFFTSLFPEQDKIYGYWFKNIKSTKLTEPFYTEPENREKYLNKKGSNISLTERLLWRNS